MGIIYAILAALCWGIATVMSKGALVALSPILLLFIQLVASVVFLWVIVSFIKINYPSWKNILKFGSLGFLEPFAAYFLGLIGLSTIEASQATLIQATEAMMIVMLSVVF